MYIHLGSNTLIRDKDIVGIFDIDKVTVNKDSREYLRKAEQKGEVKNVTFELPRSFVVANKNQKNTTYISQLSPSTLKKRAESNFGAENI